MMPRMERVRSWLWLDELASSSEEVLSKNQHNDLRRSRRLEPV